MKRKRFNEEQIPQAFILYLAAFWSTKPGPLQFSSNICKDCRSMPAPPHLP